MGTTLRAGLLIAMAVSCMPAVAAGQQSSIDSLLRRIEFLERQAADLEQRVRALESLVRVEPSRNQPVPDAADLANWRRLRMGMKMNEVRALLGEPGRVDAGPITFWRWGIGYVLFRDGKVDGWSEP